MNARWLLALALCPLAALAGEKGDVSKKKDLGAFQGQWKVQWVEREGEKIALDREVIYTIRGSKWLYQDRELCSLGLDPRCNPKLLNLTSLDGDSKGVTTEGIYKIENDLLTWCWYVEGGVKKRPTEFRAAPGSNCLVYSFIRVKP